MTLENTQTHGRNAGPMGPAFRRFTAPATCAMVGTVRLCLTPRDPSL